MTQAPTLARSFLFVPGDRPERYAKAAASGAHEIILDLEDAVAPQAKADARAHVIAWLREGHAASVRINGADTDWYEDDVRALAGVPGAHVMLPKAEPDSLARTIRSLKGRRCIALLETVRGYVEVGPLCATPGVERVAFGSIDFGVDSGIADEGGAMTGIRTQIALQSRYAGLPPPIDGVSLEFTDTERMRADVLDARRLGFGSKLCIHPRQVAVVNAAYLPTEQEVAWANRIIEAFESSKGAAVAVDGKMVDKPVVDRARRILAEGG